MHRWTGYVLIVLAALFAWPAHAQDDAKKDLPSVLIIGDAVYYQYARGTVKALAGKADAAFATWPRGIVENSSAAIEHLDQLLGRLDRNGKPVPKEKQPTWDLIHINVGLGDLIHRMPEIESFRVLPIKAGGVIATSPKQYEQNLDMLIREIQAKAPDAMLIWASTTPIFESKNDLFKPGNEVEYNEIAQRVMKRHGVAINDMHRHVRALLGEEKPSDHNAPFGFGKTQIHQPIIDAVLGAVEKKAE